MTRRKHLRRAGLLVAVALLCGMNASGREPRAGDQVADFAFTDFAGAEHHFSEFSGKYVLLDFWATWCKPCLQETPGLKRALDQFHPRGLVILGMNSDKQQASAEKFVRENEIPWLQSSPESTQQVLHHALKVKWYPTLVLVGPDGRILAVSEGENPPLYGPALMDTLEKTLPAGQS